VCAREGSEGQGTVGDYSGVKQGTATGGSFRWPLAIGAALAIAAICADVELPASEPGPNSVTVVGVTAPHPAFGSYPGLRVPVAQPKAATPYRT